VRVEARRIGAGPLLVCHPGGPGFSSHYFADLAGLAAAHELVLVDPRGTGATPRPEDGRYVLADYVDDLEQLRQELELETFDLLGHSHGGVVAQAYAAAHPDRVRRLVLASTLARFGSEQEAAVQAGIEARAGEPWYGDALGAYEDEMAGRYSTSQELAEIALREFPFYFADFGERERAYLETLRGELPNVDALKYFNEVELSTFDLRPEHARITAQTLVITGADDFITGPVCAADLAGIPNARTIILDECGHFIFVEQPDRFREAVVGFLRG